MTKLFIYGDWHMKKNTGFTLIELLLYAGLAAIVLGTVSGFYGLLLTARIKNQTINEVEQQGQHVLRQISQEVRNAENIISPTAGDSANALALDVYLTAYDPTAFDVSGGAIRVCRGGGCSAIDMTAGNIALSDLTFDNLSRSDTPGSIRIQFTLNHSSTSSRNEYDYSKIFYGSASLRQP